MSLQLLRRAHLQYIAWDKYACLDLSLSVSPEGAGTVEGAGRYEKGSIVPISAIANDGYYFKKWSDDDTNASRTVTITDSMSLTANFTQIPPEYQQIEYLQSSGTQYLIIDDNCYFSKEVTIDFEFLDILTGNQCVFGSRYNNTALWYFIVAEPPMTRFDYLSSQNHTVNASLGKIYTVKYNVSSSSVTFEIYIDSKAVFVTSFTTSSAVIPYPFYVFCGNNRGSLMNPLIGKLYSVIYDGNTLIPVRRISDNEGGLYDTVTKKFYTNQGTGSFILGGDVE